MPIVAAGIGAGASLIGGITGGKGAKKAAKIAAQSAAQDRAQALQIYSTNMGLARPTVDRGNAAGSQINALLGLGGDTKAANDALAIYKGSTGYAGRLAEGYGAINTGYAARGALESGAAQKALLNYGQQQASGEFSNYLGQLSGQQGAGLGALGSVTGRATPTLHSRWRRTIASRRPQRGRRCTALNRSRTRLLASPGPPRITSASRATASRRATRCQATPRAASTTRITVP